MFKNLNFKKICLKKKRKKISILSSFLNKNVKIHLRKEKYFEGILVGIDEYNNYLLEDAFEIREEGQKFSIGTSIVNGGCVAFIEC